MKFTLCSVHCTVCSLHYMVQLISRTQCCTAGRPVFGCFQTILSPFFIARFVQLSVKLCNVQCTKCIGLQCAPFPDKGVCWCKKSAAASISACLKPFNSQKIGFSDSMEQLYMSAERTHVIFAGKKVKTLKGCQADSLHALSDRRRRPAKASRA